MKNAKNTQLEYDHGLIVLSIATIDPENEEHYAEGTEYNADNQEINKDPIIGGADDVYRENPAKDLRDSDLVDIEPLRDEGSESMENTDEDDIATPYEGDEDNATSHTLKEGED